MYVRVLCGLGPLCCSGRWKTEEKAKPKTNYNITYCEPGATRYIPRHCCNSDNKECRPINSDAHRHFRRQAGKQFCRLASNLRQFRRKAGMETVSQAGRYGNSFAGRQVWKQFRRQAGMETVSQAGRRPEIV